MSQAVSTEESHSLALLLLALIDGSESGLLGPHFLHGLPFLVEHHSPEPLGLHFERQHFGPYPKGYPAAMNELMSFGYIHSIREEDERHKLKRVQFAISRVGEHYIRSESRSFGTRRMLECRKYARWAEPLSVKEFAFAIFKAFPDQMIGTFYDNDENRRSLGLELQSERA